MLRLACALAILVLGGFCCPSFVFAEEQQAAEPREVSAFELFVLRQDLQHALQLIKVGRFDEAEAVLKQAIERGPALPVLHYSLAIVFVQQGKDDEALGSLDTAIAQGFRDLENFSKDPRFSRLRKHPRFLELLDRIRAAAPVEVFKSIENVGPTPIEDTIALVDRNNTQWDERLRILRSYFSFEGVKPTETVYAGPDKSGAKLNRWFAKGLVAGNYGDLYDNRDRNHSNLNATWFPQLTFVEYSDEAKTLFVDRNLNSFLFFNAITIGNASLAITGGTPWRSLPRSALTQVDGAARLFLQYINNHIYVYPEHRDHDPDHGDLFPANTPYMVVSQGSSGSDKPFLSALSAILAAFKPDTKSYLRKKRLVMPTVQMIFRRGMRSAGKDRSYLSGISHPSVFRSSDIRLGQMIQMASQLDADEVPPVPLLKVVKEDSPRLGIDYFAPGMSEKLLDTPSAIGRVVRSTGYSRRLVVSAEQTKDPNNRDLTFEWSVLRGDASRITITPQNDNASIVEIVVPWHERRPVPGRPKLTTDRVDIGLFVNNGRHYSAPAFVSFMFPGDQLRRYDDNGRILHVDYAAADLAERYVDPLLFPKKEWIDEFEYDGKGRLLGWYRLRDGKKTRYTRHGKQVVTTDTFNRPDKVMEVRYVLEPIGTGIARVIEQPGERFFTYDYREAADRMGRLVAIDGK